MICKQNNWRNCFSKRQYVHRTCTIHVCWQFHMSITVSSAYWQTSTNTNQNNPTPLFFLLSYVPRIGTSRTIVFSSPYVMRLLIVFPLSYLLRTLQLALPLTSIPPQLFKHKTLVWHTQQTLQYNDSYAALTPKSHAPPPPVPHFHSIRGYVHMLVPRHLPPPPPPPRHLGGGGLIYRPSPL